MPAFGKIYDSARGGIGRLVQGAKDVIGKAPGIIRSGIVTANDALKRVNEISGKADKIYGLTKGYLPASVRSSTDKAVNFKNETLSKANQVNDAIQRTGPRIADILDQ